MAVRGVQIIGTGQLVELQRRLRAAGHENLRASMQRRVRRAAEPLQRDLQSTIRGVQMRGQTSASRHRPGLNGRPLRESIAAAIRISVRTTNPVGARVWVDRTLLPADIKNMPTTINDGRVRHPVFGNRRKWVTQWPQPSPWWDATVARHQSRMRAEIERITGDITRRLS